MSQDGSSDNIITNDVCSYSNVDKYSGPAADKNSDPLLSNPDSVPTNDVLGHISTLLNVSYGIRSKDDASSNVPYYEVAMDNDVEDAIDTLIIP